MIKDKIISQIICILIYAVSFYLSYLLLPESISYHLRPLYSYQQLYFILAQTNLSFDIFETPNIFIFLKDLSSLKASINSWIGIFSFSVLCMSICLIFFSIFNIYLLIKI